MKVEFWSSTEYTGFLAGLTRELRAREVDISQRFHISEQSYRAAATPLRRLLLRFRQYVSYPIVLIAHLIRGRFTSGPDCIVICTNTFYAPFLATLFHKRVIHLVYDLFPEALIHSGKWKEGTALVRVVRWITNKTLQRADANIFLGERLKEYVELIHGPMTNAVVIPVGADQSLFHESPQTRTEKSRSDTPVASPSKEQAAGLSLPRSDASSAVHAKAAPRILYCGNFGNMHDSATLFAYWRSVLARATSTVNIAGLEAHSDSKAVSFSDFPTFEFFCSGPKRAALEATVAELPEGLKQQIHLGGGLDQSAWIAAMEQADVALVTMVPGSETVVMPSKTYSAMMAGQAILALAPEDSDLVDLVKAADCGWWVTPGDVEALAERIQQLMGDREALLEKRQNAFNYAHKHLGQDALTQAWLEVILR